MKSVGIDLGKRQSDVCVVAEDGSVIERYRLHTTRESLSKHLVDAPRCVVAIESCRDTGWVFEHLTALGHDVVVVDTSRAREIGIGRGRRKTDRRDAEALARAAYRGSLPKAHVLSKQRRQLRDALHSRDQLVRIRGRLVTMLRGQFQGRGYVIPSGSTKSFSTRLRAILGGAEDVGTQVLLNLIDFVTTQIAALTEQLERLAEREEAFERLCSVPGVKLITALGFLSVLDDAARFNNAHEVQAYLGLVPSEYSTGGKRRPGAITRCGNTMARSLLVEAAHAMLRTVAAQYDPLVVWAKQVAQRRGRKLAIIGLARRLAGVLWAMTVDGTFYDPKGLARQSFAGLNRRARCARAAACQMSTAVLMQVPA